MPSSNRSSNSSPNGKPKPLDPFRACLTESGCTHDLARGILVSELVDGDGPFQSQFDTKDRTPGSILAEYRRRFSPIIG